MAAPRLVGLSTCRAMSSSEIDMIVPFWLPSTLSLSAPLGLSGCCTGICPKSFKPR